MKQAIGMAVLLGLAGLVVGYLLFGKVAGQYVEVTTLLQPARNIFGELAETLIGIRDIRQNILLSGAAGSILGFALGLLIRKK